MRTLTITDLKIRQASQPGETGPARSLSREEMHRVHGGRGVAVLVDGERAGVMDDYQLDFEIFKGTIGVKVV